MFARLHRAVIALAQPAAVQLVLFPDFVCKADELALDFEDGLYQLVGHEHEITADQRSKVEVLNERLLSMSGEDNAALWTDEALLANPEWTAVRDLARTVAVAFGWDLDTVPLSSATYVSGQAGD